MNYLEWKQVIRDEKLPCAVVDLDAFDRNIQKVREIFKDAKPGLTLRVATKSIRVPDLIKRILSSGAPFKGVMCYAAEEAEFLAAQGIDDFLVAYPTLQRSDLEALKRLHESGKKVRLIVDSAEGLRVLAEAMRGVHAPFEYAVDVDASIKLFGSHVGVRRSPVRSVADILKLVAFAQEYPSLKFAGVMMYEAQVAGLVDRNPLMRAFNLVAWFVRRWSMRHVRAFRKKISKELTARGHKIEIFNGGGTGNLNWALHEDALTELAAGSGFLSPHLFDYYSNIRFEPACFFALQAVRASDPDHVTCLGGGYIASGEPSWTSIPKPVMPEGLGLLAHEGCGEVQTPLKLAPGVRVAVGEPVFFRHAKAGELAERFNEYLLVSSGRVSARAQTYRGYGQSYF
jgi:D-serine deaminase-like pyridoxal phosphate-dependent protein